MKRKIATLEVFIDDTLTDSSSVGSRHDFNGRNLDKQWTIILNPNEKVVGSGAKMDLLGVFAHELGHFAAQALETPAAIMDNKLNMRAQLVWREKVMENPLVALQIPQTEAWHKIPEAIMARYHAESEAWDIAKRMNLPINEGQVEEALDSYRIGVRMVEKALTEGHLAPLETIDSVQTVILPESIMRLIEWQTGERLFWDECERTSDSDDRGDELLSDQEMP